MLRLILTVAIYLVSTFSWADDNVLVFSDLRKKVSDFPNSSLAVLDSLQNLPEYSAYKIDYLRSCAYYHMSMYYLSMLYARYVVESEEAQADTAIMKRAYVLLAESSSQAYRLEDATACVVKGKYYAHLLKDVSLEASMLLVEGDVYRKMGVIEKSYKCLEEAIDLVSGREDWFRLSHIYGYLMAYYIEDDEVEKAWKAGLERERIVDSLRRDADKSWMADNQMGYLYSKMAYLAYKMNNTALAEEYCRRFSASDFSMTLGGKLEINDYLLLRGEYGKVLETNGEFFRDMDANDSLNIIFLRTLYQSAKAYSGLGNYEEAFHIMMRMNRIETGLRTNIERNNLFQLADLSRAKEQEYRLQYASDKLMVRNYVIIGLVLTVVLVGVILAGSRVIHRKNKKMALMMVELNDKQHSIDLSDDASSDGFPDEEKVISEKMSNKHLFLRFNKLVHADKLYLNYQLSRDDYARLMGVDRNRFALVMKEYAKSNLSTFLNELRLEYSVELFRLHPEWSVNEIAVQSAFPNLSTFYRLFKEKYGISPSAFRRQLEKFC